MTASIKGLPQWYFLDSLAAATRKARTRAITAIRVIIQRNVNRMGGTRMAGTLVCQTSILNHPFHVPASSGARLSAPTMVQALHPCWTQARGSLT